MRTSQKSKITSEEKTAALFLLVPVVLLILFMILPVIIAVGMSFTDYDVINPPKWVGLSNFKKMWKDEIFRVCLKNTVMYTALYVPLGLLAALGSALFLNGRHKAAAIFRTFYYIPVLSSTVATSTLWFWVLNPRLGLLNQSLRIFGIQGPAWLYNSKTAMISIVLMSVWAGFGSNMMIFLAGLKGIPRERYESAKIDGAGRLQSFLYITLPSLQKTTFLVSTLLLISAFQVFDQAFVLTRGGPGNATITVVYYIYNMGFKNLKVGYASSISLILFLMIGSMTFLNSKWSREEGEIK